VGLDNRELNLAKIGLIALIDEATGYQNVRPRNDLRAQHQALSQAANASAVDGKPEQKIPARTRTPHGR
jgi:hypothetical protein